MRSQYIRFFFVFVFNSVQEYQNLEETLSEELEEQTSRFKNIKHEKKAFDQCVQSILRIRQIYARKKLEQIREFEREREVYYL